MYYEKGGEKGWKDEKKLRFLSMLFVCFNLLFTVAYGLDFTESRSARYRLSNGKTVRIEYHNGQPHIHELDKNGKSIGSENINNSDRHHSNEGGISKGTRDIVKNGNTKSQEDKQANKKAKEYGDEFKKVEKQSKDASKKFIEKNKSKIQEAGNKGKVFVIIGGTLYIVWWLFKIASGWGLLIPV